MTIKCWLLSSTRWEVGSIRNATYGLNQKVVRSDEEDAVQTNRKGFAISQRSASVRLCYFTSVTPQMIAVSAELHKYDPWHSRPYVVLLSGHGRGSCVSDPCNDDPFAP